MTHDPTNTKETDMADIRATLPPPSKHQLALMIWLAVFPTLTVLNIALGDSSPSYRAWCGRSSSRPWPSRS